MNRAKLNKLDAVATKSYWVLAHRWIDEGIAEWDKAEGEMGDFATFIRGYIYWRFARYAIMN